MTQMLVYYSSMTPIMLYCSAGVGRTGTYIAVDRLLQRIQDHDDIDIYSLVLEMRDYRCRMVQTEVCITNTYTDADMHALSYH